MNDIPNDRVNLLFPTPAEHAVMAYTSLHVMQFHVRRDRHGLPDPQMSSAHV
jgi:hypothetical protein